MNVLSKFIRRRALRVVQPVARPDNTNSDWIKEVLKNATHDPVKPPSPPEPPMDFWLVDNAARVAGNNGETK